MVGTPAHASTCHHAPLADRFYVTVCAETEGSPWVSVMVRPPTEEVKIIATVDENGPSLCFHRSSGDECPLPPN